MKTKLQFSVVAVSVLVLLTLSGCDQPVQPNSAARQPAEPVPNAATPTNSAVPPTAPDYTARASDWAVTLPVLDAFFEDPTFSAELKSKLQLTDTESVKLKAIANEATAELRKTERENSELYTQTSDLRMKAENSIKSTIGEERTRQLFALVAERWSGGTPEAARSEPGVSGAVPADTRIVVNIPAFRMDVFDNGTLIKSYKIGIGYPEFPLPTGLRQADTIIFNPTWTPPDEPWVEAPGSKVEVGKTVKAGDKLNPLGLLKIPIGLPSLIHGGKAIAKIGAFASHGCVGLTDVQAKDFAKMLAQIRDVELTDDQIAQHGKNKTETKLVKLGSPVPVELRYETIVVEDGKLQIYRDVYDRNTNTEEHLNAVLQANGITLDQLSEPERKRVMTGLSQMSRDATGKLADDDSKVADSRSASGASDKGSVKDPVKPKSADARTPITRNIKGQKAVVVEIALLKGKGYPAQVDLDSGAGTRTSRSKNIATKAKGPRK